MNDRGRIKTLAFPWGKAKVKNIKTLAADSKNSVDMPPDSSPEFAGQEASSSCGSLPPLPEIQLSPPPPSLRAGGLSG